MDSTELKSTCIDTLEDLKAQDLLALDIKGISDFADWLIIATALSSRNAKAISNKVIEFLKDKDQHIINVEGQDESEWVLIDCGDVVINVMQKKTREYYDLESLWGETTLISA